MRRAFVDVVEVPYLYSRRERPDLEGFIYFPIGMGYRIRNDRIRNLSEISSTAAETETKFPRLLGANAESGSGSQRMGETFIGACCESGTVCDFCRM